MNNINSHGVFSGMKIMVGQLQRYIQLLIIGAFISLPAQAAIVSKADTTLESITYSTLPGDLVQIRLSLSGDIKEPGSFTIDNPARIALDFPNTKSNLARKNKSIGVGATRSVTAVEAGGRTRVVINLTQLVSYQTKLDGNDVIVTLNAGGQEIASSTAATPLTSSDPVGKSVSNIDFRRGEKGEGRIIVTLSNPNTAVDMSKQGKQVYVTLQNTKLPDELERRLDVIDFATPVRTVDAFKKGADVRMVIAASGNYDHIAYQTDNRFTINNNINTLSIYTLYN